MLAELRFLESKNRQVIGWYRRDVWLNQKTASKGGHRWRLCDPSTHPTG